jgi:glycine/D-amino acid oxidase-like deaminating enzyme
VAILPGVTTYDVGIVGAGVHGAAIAYHLADRGVSVAIFEREGPASGPTGRSSAICRAYYTNAFLASVARDAIEMMVSFEEHTGRSAEFRRTGLLFLHPPEDADGVRSAVATLNELGIATELLEPDAIAARYPAMDLEGIGVAAGEAGAGYADPHAVTRGLFDRAVERGVEPHLGAAVAEIRADAAGGGTIVTASGEERSCGRVVIAAGPWTGPLARSLGIDLPIHAERHVVATFRWNGAEPCPPHGDILGGYYLRPEGEEQFLVGPLHEEPQVDPDAPLVPLRADEVERLAERVVARNPKLAASASSGGWSSLYDVSRDWQPVIGEIAPGVFVDAGTSGHGFKLAPALGRHIADLVLGEDVDPGLGAFDPFRFERGEALAAGYRENRILG